MSDKKDMLEFPLETVEVPQAIVLMMQAATKCVCGQADGVRADLEVDNDRLQELCEKLEARVEDAIEAASAVRTEPVEEDEPVRYEDSTDEDVITKVFRDNELHQVVVDGVVFMKACNERVENDLATSIRTFCIKQWGHINPDHEDEFGNVR